MHELKSYIRQKVNTTCKYQQNTPPLKIYVPFQLNVVKWLRGYAATCLRDYAVRWLRGWVVTWFRGYAATWLRCCVATRLRGYAHMRLRGCVPLQLRG